MRGVLAPTEAKLEIDALLERHDRSEEAAAVAFFSFESPQSFIGARDPDGTITPLIGFWPLPVRGRELLDAIAGIDENGERLVANYEAAFPELAQTVGRFGAGLEPVESESLGWLLAACSLVLGMQTDDVTRALAPVPSLVKLDTVVEQREGRYAFDSRRLLRSAMSFRIGAVPNHVVARSTFDSLGDYAANAVRRLLRDWTVDVVACAGDLFARNQFIAERTRRGLVRPGLHVLFPTVLEEA
jgi:hypothetical protein